MQSLTLGLIPGQKKQLRTLPDAHHLRCNILVSICEALNPIMQQEPLIGERAESPFLIYTEME